MARPNQFDVKPNPESPASLFSAINSDLKDRKIIKVCQSHNNRNLFFVITEDKTRALTCHNIEIEAPATMAEEACEASFLDVGGPLPDRGQTISRRETMKRAPQGGAQDKDKEKGDAFGFFSAFKFVKEIMASDSNAILKKNAGAPNKGKLQTDAQGKGLPKDRIIPKIEESKIAAGPEEELLNPLTASARSRAGGHKASLRVGDDDSVEEVRESTFVPAVPGGELPNSGQVNPGAFLGFDDGAD